MIRIAAAIAVWVIVVGGAALYLRVQESRSVLPPASAEAAAQVAGFSVELTPTFAAAPDPFALQLDADVTAPALVARLNGAEILRRADTLAAGETIRINELPPIGEGLNELYIEASPLGEEALQAHALRVRVLQGGRVIADDTLWSEPGGTIAAAVTFEAAPEPEPAHEH